MNNHYVFLRPGEKIFILTDAVAGDNDYTHVIEAEIPVHPVPDYDGSPRHRIAPELITARRYAELEPNECANLSCGEPANNVLEGYARFNEERLGNDPDDAFVARPIGAAPQQTGACHGRGNTKGFLERRKHEEANRGHIGLSE